MGRSAYYFFGVGRSTSTAAATPAAIAVIVSDWPTSARVWMIALISGLSSGSRLTPTESKFKTEADYSF
jgi:hypothetical protein